MLHCSSVVNMEKANFTNFEIHKKLTKIVTTTTFRSGDQEKKDIYTSEKKFGGLVAI